jgi:hypothetical protein
MHCQPVALVYCVRVSFCASALGELTLLLDAEEVRIRWLQTARNAETLYARIRDIVNGSVEAAEESLNRILEVLSGRAESASHKAKDMHDSTSEKAGEQMKMGGEKLKGEL